jgi:hypothetical protein
VRVTASDVLRRVPTSGARARTVSLSAASRDAVAAMTSDPAETISASAAWCEPSVRSTVPASRTSPPTEARWRSRMVRMTSRSSVSGPSSPSAWLTSSPRPRSAPAPSVNSDWTFSRVSGSSIPSTRSSGCVASTLAGSRSPPSVIFGASRLPGDSTTNVSPSSVFCRSTARVSAGIGA